MEPRPAITTQVSQTSQNYILKCYFSKKLTLFLDSVWKQYQFSSFQNRGKYKQFKYLYNQMQGSLQIAINKRYYFDVLMHKKYQLVVFAKCILGMSQQFLQTQKFLTETAKSRVETFTIVSIDVLALTLAKQFTILNPRNQLQVKKLFLRVSLLEFRRNLVSKAKQSDQHFSAIVVRMKPKSAMLSQEEQKEQSPQYVPSDQMFYKAPRVSFLDDLFTNQSLVRRFNRFIIFFQIHSLFLGTIPLEHPLIKQFYQRCSLRCSIVSTRLKKILIQFRFTRCESNNVFKEHTATLTLNCVQDDVFKNERLAWEERISSNNERYKFPESNKQGNLFLVQLYCDSLEGDKKIGNYNHINSKFLFCLKSIINDPKVQTPFLQFYELNSSITSKMLRIKNQVGFCQILVQLSQFIDVLCYNSLSNFSSHQPRTNPQEEVYDMKLPAGRIYKRGLKFTIYYTVEIKLLLQSKKQDRQRQRMQGQMQRELEVQINDPLKQSKESIERQGCNHILGKILMHRKRQSDLNSPLQVFEYNQNSEYTRGLAYYIKQLLSKQNLRDCFNQVLEIVTHNMNMITDKNTSSNNSYKRFKYMQAFALNVSNCLEAFTKLFASIDTLFVIRVINIIEQFADLEDKQPRQVKSWFTFTFEVKKITMAGWMELIPVGLYIVEVNKQKVSIGKITDERKEEVSISKDKVEKVMANLKNYFGKSFNVTWLDYFKFWNQSR